ncbi:hypothetical protein [Leucobacter insecticola]|nr:hypothetical protein [Leucobacter insecticola]
MKTQRVFTHEVAALLRHSDALAAACKNAGARFGYAATSRSAP